MNTMSWAVITGASSGIGRAIAELFAKDDVHVVLCARDASELERVADNLTQAYGIQVLVVSGNLAKPEVRKKLFQKTEDLQVDFLVNAAGFGDMNELITADTERLEAMIAVNISALTELTQGFAQRMVLHKHGHILNVASIAAYLPGPTMAVYHASKAYVLSFSQAVAEELAPRGVAVTVLCPGPTKTKFAEYAHADQSKVFKGSLATAEEVAIFGYTAMKLKKRVAIPGLTHKITTFSAQFVPSRLRTHLIRKALIKTKN
jgi:short-subunit dehydrogenase